jgi:cell division transport system permease protein
MAYALREAFAAVRRAPVLTGLSSVMIGLSLFLCGLFGVAAYNVRKAVERLEARVEIVAYLNDDAAPAAVQIAQREIGRYAEVAAVYYISREQALEIARRDLPEFRAVLNETGDNPLPASFEVRLKPGQRGVDAVKAVALRVATYPFVEDVRYGREWLDKVYVLRRIAGAATLILGLAFAIVAALIIGAAVRLAIFARRDEIAIMRLVGATDAFVRRPFLLEGFMTGILGALLAIIGTYSLYRVISGAVFQLDWLPVQWIVIGTVAGGLVGVLASAVAVRRHLREI